MSSMNFPMAEFDTELVRRFDRPGPRYTSYPTADRFVEAFGEEAYRSWAGRRNIGGVQRPLALYVHLPFCSTVCFYCACNKFVTRDRTKGTRYMDYLTREVGLQAALFHDDPNVEQMHWGGGTPTFYDPAELAKLFAVLRQHFEFAPNGEYSIEVDPRTVDAAAIDALRAMGFNRISLGVQDLDAEVQRAVNRIQTEEQIETVIQSSRSAGFQSVNIDLIYGLPRQNLLTFNRTLARIVGMRPDRIAVYNYAHLPERFKPQRQVAASELPGAEAKLKLLGLAAQQLTAAGYVYIGMDHFAQPGDALAVAQRVGRLHRNFQGYSTHAHCDLIGLGVSAIGSIGPTYSQNHRDLEPYYDALDRSELPVMRGVELSADDLLRRAVIQSLMCQFELDKQTIGIAYLIEFDRYFEPELAGLRDFEKSGLLRIDDRWITITPKGRMLIRTICMIFDKYLRRERETRRYSKVL